jgi:predicted AAA+ superfamily ATPase
MMNKDLVKQVLVEQNQYFLKRETGVERDALAAVIKKSALPHIHVITGMRRSGKSTLMRQIVKKFFNDQGFFYLNFEDERFLNFKAEEFNSIHESLIELFGENKVFFIDEAQNVEGFELFVRRLSDQGYKIFLTGSNANLLSHEISSRLTGRHVDTNLLPFSYIEFLRFHQIGPEKKDVFVTEKRALFQKEFNEYMSVGGMPEYLKFQDDEILMRIYEDIVVKDIAVRYKITNLFQLKQLYQILISNFSTRFSFRSLVEQTGIQSNITVQNYLGYLENGNFGKVLNKFDHSTKKQINSQKKFYLTDHAFIPKISTKLTKDYGKTLENIVFMALIGANEVYYFSEKNECDFIAINLSKEAEAFQVCYDLNDENKKREIAGLSEAMQYLNLAHGTILTMSQDDELAIDDKQIRIIPVWKWLIQNHTL